MLMTSTSARWPIATRGKVAFVRDLEGGIHNGINPSLRADLTVPVTPIASVTPTPSPSATVTPIPTPTTSPSPTPTERSATSRRERRFRSGLSSPLRVHALLMARP